MMLPPLPCLYICRSAARVVRKAPSRWMASSCFHLAKGKSSSGATIWMPALLTRMSRRPKVLIAFAMPASTCSSEVTSMATPMARRSDPPSSAAAASAPAWFRSAMATLAPSRTKVRAISLPIPLAAPVTTATRFFRRMACLLGSLEIVVRDLAEAEGQVGDDVDARHDLQDRKLGHRRQRMRVEVERGRAGPGAFDRDVLEVVLDELADARRAVDMRDDLQQEVRCGERYLHRRQIRLLVLVAHRPRRHAHRAVVERADERVDLDVERGLGELLREAPELAAARDRRIVVEEHAVRIAALAAAESDRDDLAGLGVIAVASRVRHADELVFDDSPVRHERLRDQRAELLRVGAVGDDEILAVDEAVGPRRIGRARQRHGKGAFSDFMLFHAALRC